MNIYVANNMVLDQLIRNENNTKIIIDGMYDIIKYKLIGMNSNESTDTIIINSNNKKIQLFIRVCKIKNIIIGGTNRFNFTILHDANVNIIKCN